MFWIMLDYLISLLIIIILVSQVIYPIFVGKRFFWLFRGSERVVLTEEQMFNEEMNRAETLTIRNERIKLKEKNLENTKEN